MWLKAPWHLQGCISLSLPRGDEKLPAALVAVGLVQGPSQKSQQIIFLLLCPCMILAAEAHDVQRQGAASSHGSALGISPALAFMLSAAHRCGWSNPYGPILQMGETEAQKEQSLRQCSAKAWLEPAPAQLSPRASCEPLPIQQASCKARSWYFGIYADLLQNLIFFFFPKRNNVFFLSQN